MYLTDTLRVLLRRWLLLVVGLALTGLAGHWVLGQVGSDYQATGQMVFLLPPDAMGNVPMNPYLNLQGGLSSVAALSASHVMTADAESELVAAGSTAEYDVALAPGTGPLLLVTAKDKDPQVAVATRDAVMAELTRTLGELQAGKSIPTNQLISSQVSNVSPKAEVLPGSRLRALVATVGAGMLLLLVTTFALDRLLARRKEDETTAPVDDAAVLDRVG